MKLLYVLLLVFGIDKLAGQFYKRCIDIEDDGLNIVVTPEYFQYSTGYHYRSWSLVVGQDALQSSGSTKELCMERTQCDQVRNSDWYTVSLNRETLDPYWQRYTCSYTMSADGFNINIKASWSSITLHHSCEGHAQACITDSDGKLYDVTNPTFEFSFGNLYWVYHMACSDSCENGTAEQISSTRVTQPTQLTTPTITPSVTNVAVSTITPKTATSESTTRVTSPLSSHTTRVTSPLSSQTTRVTSPLSSQTTRVTSPLSSQTNTTTGSSTNGNSFSERMSMSTAGDQSQQLTQSAVIGISVAAVAIIALIITLLVFLLLRKRAPCSKIAKKPASPAQVLNGPSNAGEEYSVVLKHDEDTVTYRATPGAMYQHPGLSTSHPGDYAEDDEYYQGDFEFHGPEPAADNGSELSYELARAIPNGDSHARDSNADNMYGNLDECGEGIPANIREGADPVPDAYYNCPEENNEDTTYYNL